MQRRCTVLARFPICEISRSEMSNAYLIREQKLRENLLKNLSKNFSKRYIERVSRLYRSNMFSLMRQKTRQTMASDSSSSFSSSSRQQQIRAASNTSEVPKSHPMSTGQQCPSRASILLTNVNHVFSNASSGYYLRDHHG